MNKRATYGLVVGSALAASLAFIGTASADMYQAGNCAFNASPVCNAEAGSSQNDSMSGLSRTEKDNGFNNGNDVGSDRRQGTNPTSGADRRQDAGARSSIGDHGGRGGGNRSGSGRR